jgi:intein/homing endonuclease
MENNEWLDWAWKNKNVKYLCAHYFNEILTPGQERIVRTVAFDEHKRVTICCMTRYGKSFSVSMGMLLWIFHNENKKIAIIAPTNEKTSIIRNYLIGFVAKSAEFMDLLDLDKKGVERIKKEVSRKRMTWKNGVEMRTLSAEGKGEALMGFGAEKCVSANTSIITNLGCIKIKDIVQNKLNVKVLSYNLTDEKLFYKPIVNYIINKTSEDFYLINNKLKCTGNHPIYVLNKGWTQARDLCVNDKIYIHKQPNCFHGNNKLRSVRKPVLQKTFPHTAGKTSILQSQMQSNMAIGKKQLCLERWKNKKNMPNLRRRILGGFCKTKQSKILFKQMQICQMESASPKKIKRKNLFVLSKNISTKNKSASMLWSDMCQQTACNKNGYEWKSRLERWNKKFALPDRFQHKIKNKNQNERKSSMFYLSEKEKISNTPYKLYENRQPNGEFNRTLYKLSYKDQLQSGALGVDIVCSIKRISKPKITYNLEIKDNNNYFADNILVHNCIVDEVCDIDFEVFRSKITRMLGDNPGSSYVEIGNPHHRENQFFLHWTNPEWFQIRIDWKQALSEGRISKAFVDEQKGQLTDREFTILYDANFPLSSEDQLIPYEWIMGAVK